MPRLLWSLGRSPLDHLASRPANTVPLARRYARNKEGQVIPWAVIEEHVKASHPYEVSAAGGTVLLTVPVSRYSSPAPEPV